MMPWKHCGDPAHKHAGFDDSIACMIATGRWWTIIESDKMQKDADVNVSHPKIEVPSSLSTYDLMVLSGIKVAIMQADRRKIRVAMRAMRKGEGSLVAAAAPYN